MFPDSLASKIHAQKNKREKIAKLIKEEDKNFKNNVINNPIETESKLNIQKGIEYVEINNEEDKNEMYYKESNFVLPTIEQNI